MGRIVPISIRVHLADDHTMFRDGLVAILASLGNVEVIGQSSTTGDDAVALIERNKPDVVITQIDQNLKTAEKVLSEIRSASPRSRIIVLTMFDNLHYLKALSRLGIDAYVHKSASSRDLIATIDSLSQDPGGDNVVVCLPRSALERVGDGPISTLSERETEVVVLAARGLSNNQIGTELQISEATVKRHLANVYQKIGVRSRSEAVRMALVEQWIGFNDLTAVDLDGLDGSDGSSGSTR